MLRPMVSALLLSVSTVALSCLPEAASACDIQPVDDPPTVAERFDESATVALVTVVDEHEPVLSHHRASYDVDYTEIWKGSPLPGGTVDVVTHYCGGGPRLDVGDRVLILQSDSSTGYRVWDANLSLLDELRQARGDGATAATDPERFDRLNTHHPLPVPAALVDPLGILPTPARWLVVNLVGLQLAVAALCLARGTTSPASHRVVERGAPGRTSQ